MAIDINRGRAFVHEHGTLLERARLAALLDDVRPASVPPELQSLQNPDGGFPYRLQSGAPSTLNHTVQVLEWLADFGLTDEPVAGGARAYLRAHQTNGGIWREDRALAAQHQDLPLWMDPDSNAADVYTTAYCASVLIGDLDTIVQIDRAVTWLQTQQGHDGLLHGFKIQSSAIALPVFADLLGDEARPTRRIVAGLGRAFARDWDAEVLTELLIRFRQAGYGFHTEVVVRTWEQLQLLQAADGSFATEDPADTVAITIKALDIARSVQSRR